MAKTKYTYESLKKTPYTCSVKTLTNYAPIPITEEISVFKCKTINKYKPTYWFVSNYACDCLAAKWSHLHYFSGSLDPKLLSYPKGQALKVLRDTLNYLP